MTLPIIKKLLPDIKLIYADNKVLQQLVLTQAILESGYLQYPEGSQLARKFHNLFGIKGKGDAGSIRLQTWEVIGGKKRKIYTYFAAYTSPAACIERHKEIMQLARYAPVKVADTPEEAFLAISRGGWATDPDYSKKLMAVWEKYVKDDFTDYM